MGAATPAAGTSMTSKSTAVLAVGGAAVVLLVAGLLFSFHLTSPDAATIAARVRASGALAPLVLITLLVAQAVVAPLPSPPTDHGWASASAGSGCCSGRARASAWSARSGAPSPN